MGAQQRIDLAAGITAALAFLAFTFALHMNVIVGALLASGAYVGIRLLLSDRQAPPPRPVALTELLTELNGTLQSLPPGDIRRKVTDIQQQATAMLSYFDENPQEREVWDDVVRDCLTSSLRLVKRYAGVARHLQAGEDGAVKELVQVLDNVAQTFAAMRRRLLQSDAAGLEDDLKAFRSTLAAVNEVVEVHAGGAGGEQR